MRERPQTVEQWTAYIDNEVTAVCDRMKWSRQIRRKWSARAKPVAESSIDDYEWKLVPDSSQVESLIQEPTDFDEGIYYVLGVDTCNGDFLFQHDTLHCGIMGRNWNMTTVTRIGIRAILGEGPVVPLDEDNRLRDYLFDLVARFQPNSFCLT
jgi:hypothetical protein